jgi:hypothetical protein
MISLRIAVLGAGLALFGLSAATADEAARTLAASHLEAGTLAAGDAALAAVIAADPKNDDARLGLGVIRFVRAVEHLSQGLYRYGLRPPPNAFMLPVVRLPVPENPNPEPVTYDDFRKLILDFVADLAAADAALAPIESSDVKLPLDLRKIRYAVGTNGTTEPFIAVIQRVSAMRDEDLAASLQFSFDKGDALWLRGYSHVLMAVGEFFLAYDWHESFNYTFHLFFPRAGLPFTTNLTKPEGDDFNYIADLISFVHIRWPLAEPERLKVVREHLKTVIALSRASWDAIEAETDNDHEWLPNPKQTSPFALLQIDEKQIAAWRGMLSEAKAILDGKKLVPHWRFKQGFNLRRVFEEPQPFDFVLWITGPAVLPYLEDGPIETSEDWAAIVSAFGDNFGMYAAWLN